MAERPPLGPTVMVGLKRIDPELVQPKQPVEATGDQRRGLAVEKPLGAEVVTLPRRRLASGGRWRLPKGKQPTPIRDTANGRRWTILRLRRRLRLRNTVDGGRWTVDGRLVKCEGVDRGFQISVYLMHS